MLKQVNYLTDEQGKKIGVLIDLETYDRLTNSTNKDPELLLGLNQKELTALATTKLAIDEQEELSTLLAKNQTEIINDNQQEKLDYLLAKIDNLNVLKTRAIYTLEKLK